MRSHFRTSLALCVLLIPACTYPPSIPAPWEAVEPQSAEPPVAAPAKLTPKWARFGASVRGKALMAATIGEGPRRIYIIGGIHGDEPEAPATAELLPELLAESANLPNSTIRVVKDMNPDGAAAKTRTNTRRVDLERNWPSKDFQREARSGDRPLSELETLAVHTDLLAFKPDIVIVFQSANLPPSVSSLGSGRTLAHSFCSAARKADPHWRFSPEQRNRPPGSIESLVGVDMGKTVLRVEFQRNTAASRNARAVLAGLTALDQPPAQTPPASSTPSTPASSPAAQAAPTGR